MAHLPDGSGSSRSRNIQAALILSVLVLGLGALGAHFGLHDPLAAPEGSVMRAPPPVRTPASAQVHRAASADLDVGPGEAEPTLVSCPPAVR